MATSITNACSTTDLSSDLISFCFVFFISLLLTCQNRLNSSNSSHAYFFPINPYCWFLVLEMSKIFLTDPQTGNNYPSDEHTVTNVNQFFVHR